MQTSPALKCTITTRLIVPATKSQLFLSRIQGRLRTPVRCVRTRASSIVRSFSVPGSTAVSQETPPEVIEAAEALKKVATRPIGQFIDEEEILKDSTFPIKPNDLIELAKAALKDPYDNLSTNVNYVDADQFAFKGPVIGPLNYEQFTNALKGFSLQTVFPGFQSCLHNFWVDPYEPNRVWYTQRFYGKHDGSVFGKPPTGKIVDGTPCMQSLVFNEEGKIIKCTVGYPMDRDIGNTGGLGGVFGPLWAIGAPLPFPEAKPYQPSWQFKFFNVANKIARFFSKKD